VKFGLTPKVRDVTDVKDRGKKEDNPLRTEMLAMNYEVKLRIELSECSAKIVEFGCSCCCEKHG
jgi:hypothetical protein